jgi:poly-gamma-glutamate synthesis protein (capsule biosynthesis protein)
MTDAIRIAATGDIVLTRAAADCAPDPAVDELGDLLGTADVVLSSVEIAFSDRGEPSDRILNFRAAPALLPQLHRFHLSVATLANNHSSDYGWPALADTAAGLASQGIAPLGAGVDLAAAERPHVVEVHGRRIGILAWSCLLPLGVAAGPGRAGIAPIHIRTEWEVDGEFQLEEPGVPPRVRTAPRPHDLDRALAAVRALRSEVDVLVVTVHWGFGFGQDRAEYQQPLGRAFIDAGADAVLGHHVHAPQGVEIYRSKPIVYSPGNFVAQQPREGVSPDVLAICDAMSRDAFVSVVTIAPDGAVGLELVPVVGNDDGLPGLAGDTDRDRIAAQLVERSVELGTDLVMEDGRVVSRGSDRTRTSMTRDIFPVGRPL